MHHSASSPFKVPEHITLIELAFVAQEQRDTYTIPTEQFLLTRQEILQRFPCERKSTPIYFLGKVDERDVQGSPLKITVLLGETTYSLERACMLFDRWDALLQDDEHSQPFTVGPRRGSPPALTRLFDVVEAHFGFVPYEDYVAMIDELLHKLRPKLLRLARAGHISYAQLYQVVSHFYRGSDQWHQDITNALLIGVIDQVLAFHSANHPEHTALTAPSVYMDRSALESTVCIEANACPEGSLKYEVFTWLYEVLSDTEYSKEAILALLQERIRESEGTVQSALRVHLRAVAWRLDEAPYYRLLLPTSISGKDTWKKSVLLLLDHEDGQRGWYGYPLRTSHEEEGPSRKLRFYSRQKWREKCYDDDEEDDYEMKLQ